MRKTSILLAAMLIAGTTARSQNSAYQGLSILQITDSIHLSNAEYAALIPPPLSGYELTAASKSASAIVLQLDSITSPENYRIEYTYDGEGNVVSETQYAYNPETSMYELGTKIEFSYNDNMYLIGRLQQQWNPLADGWDNQTLDEFEFDAEGNELLSQSSSWTTEWVALERREQTFDSEGRLNERVEFAPIANFGSELVPDMKSTYSYGGDGLLSETLVEEWEESDMGAEIWNPRFQRFHSYENGLQVSELTNAWSEADAEWQSALIRSFTYEGGLETLMIAEQWNPVDEVWAEVSKIERAYTASGTESVTAYYIMEEDGWRPVFTNELVFGAGDNAEQVNVYVWDQNSQELYLNSSAQYSFDLDYEIDQLAIPHWYQNTPRIKNKPEGLSLTAFLPNGLEVFQITEEFHYSAFAPLTTLNTENTKLLLYPNPASDFVNISTGNKPLASRLELFDLHGRKVMDQITGADEQISIAGIPSGMYIYRLNGGNDTQTTGKLVKQ